MPAALVLLSPSSPSSPSADWLDARPLRTHVRHLMDASGLSAEMLAALAGVPVRATRSLAAGRGGRPVRRVHADVARRLLRVTAHDARRTRTLLVAVTPVRARLQRLAIGRTPDEVASRLGLTRVRVVQLLSDAPACTQAEALAVVAAHRAALARNELGRAA